MTAKKILQLVPTLQSMAILSENVKLSKKKKATAKDFVGTGVKSIIGIEMAKITADTIESF